MAVYADSDRFWVFDEEVVPVTVITTDIKLDRQRWVKDMLLWAKGYGMRVQWQGESANTVDGRGWQQADFLIQGEHNRTLFALRWS